MQYLYGTPRLWKKILEKTSDKGLFMKLKYTFKDKTAIVTGASSGIGRALAYSLAEKGANMMLAARREERLRTIVEEIGRKGGSAAYCVTDITVESGGNFS